MCKQSSEIKAYGAGILGGVQDINFCFSGKPVLKHLDLEDIINNYMKYTIAETRSNVYFLADSFQNAKNSIL